MMSRLNDDYFQNNNLNEGMKLEKVTSSTSKSKFVFSVSKKHYKQIKINEYDKKFFEKIIWQLYGKKTRHNLIKKFLFDFFLLYRPNYNFPDGHFKIDQKYVSYGWSYPRKITQIAFFAVILLSFVFFYFINSQFSLSINKINIHITGLVISVLMLLFWWYYKYVSRLRDIIFGKYSIDGYCWHFFPYRIQYLNNTYKYIPIYFSRNFIRFFKTNIYIRNIDNIEYLEKILKDRIEDSLEYLNKLINKILHSKNKTKVTYDANEINNLLNYDVIKSYYKKLKLYDEFNEKERILHKLIVTEINNNLDIK